MRYQRIRVYLTAEAEAGPVACTSDYLCAFDFGAGLSGPKSLVGAHGSARQVLRHERLAEG